MKISDSALDALRAEAPGTDGQRHIIRLAVNAVAQARGLRAPWTIDLPDDQAQRISKILSDLDGLDRFDVVVPCPADPECSGTTWTPADSISDLHLALTGTLHNGEGTFCTVHGEFDDDADQETDNPDSDPASVVPDTEAAR